MASFTQSNGDLKFRKGVGIKALWYAITKPSPSLIVKEEVLRVQLLSGLLVTLILLFLIVNISYMFFIPGYIFPAADLIGYILLFSQYILSRSKFYKIAILLLFIMFPLVTFSNILGGTSTNLSVTLSFLVLSYILGSLLLSPQGLILYGLGVNLVIFNLPQIAPDEIDDLSSIVGALAINLVGFGLTVLANIYRQQVGKAQREELETANTSTIEGLASALELHSKETIGHSLRVVEMTLTLSNLLGIAERELIHIRHGVLLHDIGKMGISSSILQKSGSLDADEWKVIKEHPTVAKNLLEPFKFLRRAIDIPYCHHERWNGTGYPRGLVGEDIPLPARIFAVVDVYDALLSKRSYGKVWSKPDAMQYLVSNSGILFDPMVVDGFLGIID